MAEPQISTGTSLDSVVSGIGKPMDTATYQKGLGRIEKGLEEDRQARKEIPSNEPPKLDPEPQLKDFQTDPWQSFGSFAGVLATLGSLMTKRPLENALNAGSSVMNAKSKGDYAAYQDAFNKWKTNSDNAWKMADWHQTQTKDMYDRLKDDQSSLNAEMGVWSASTQDPSLDHAIKGLDLQNAVLSREKAVKELKKANDDIELEHKKATSIVDEWKQKNGVTDDKAVPQKVFIDAQLQAKSDIKSAEKGNSGSGSGVLTDEKYEEYKNDPSMAPALKAYMHSGSVSTALGAAGSRNSSYQERAAALRRMAQENDPDFDPAMAALKYSGYKKELATVEAQNGKISLASNILDSSIPSLIDSAKKLNLGPSTSINALYNAAKKQFNDADFKNFSTQLRAATTDYAQFIGRGQGTVHSDEESLKILNEHMNTASLNGFKDAVTQERNNVQSGIDKTLQDIDAKVSGKGQPTSNPETKIIDGVTYQKINGEWHSL